jgi:hypothetical protein|tara:strand:- start:1162 stop:1350 length:189 start_codon:yes stop_codon:yes gene_type:complete
MIELKIKELWAKGEISHLGDMPDDADMQTLKVFADLEDVLKCKQINWNHYWDRINWNKLLNK